MRRAVVIREENGIYYVESAHQRFKMSNSLERCIALSFDPPGPPEEYIAHAAVVIETLLGPKRELTGEEPVAV